MNGLRLGRILLAAVFVGVGWRKLRHPRLYALYMRSRGIRKATRAILYTAAITEFAGGLVLACGWLPRWSASGLLLFLVPTTVIFHPFWRERGRVRELRWIEFMKNVAIAGGLTLLLGWPT